MIKKLFNSYTTYPLFSERYTYKITSRHVQTKTSFAKPNRSTGSNNNGQLLT